MAFADLDQEPLVLSVPDTQGRYYVIALMDLWTNVFGSIGKRTTGTGGGSFLIAGPDWQGTPPANVKGVFRAPTRFVRVKGQIRDDREGVKKHNTENGWIVMPKDMGNYGTDYETRAGIALVGLGAIEPADVVYPTAFFDGDGATLDGANRYVRHFEKGQTPPTNATWSVSMYDPQGYYVPNAMNRYNLAMWMPLQYNSGGSLDLYIQAASPGAGKEANWLPAPADGPFNLTVRDYWPTAAVLDGSYKLPPVRKVQ